jgi:arylsulfatase I/J
MRAALLIAALVCPAISAPAQRVAAPPPPRVIFTVVVDDLGFANVGWRSPNPPESATPRLVELRGAGVGLERQINHFTCTPSRSAFMSGRLPVHVQVTLANPDVQNAGMPVNMTSLPQRLALAGYDSFIAGKQVSSGLSISYPLSRHANPPLTPSPRPQMGPRLRAPTAHA